MTSANEEAEELMRLVEREDRLGGRAGCRPLLVCRGGLGQAFRDLPQYL